MKYKDVLTVMQNSPANIFSGSCPNAEEDYGQRHVHEYLGSTGFAGSGERTHNHRFAGVTGEAIPTGEGRHIHKFMNNTDFVEEHFHRISDETGPDIAVGNGKHVHFARTVTTLNDGHRHKAVFATLIGPDPLP